MLTVPRGPWGLQTSLFSMAGVLTYPRSPLLPVQMKVKRPPVLQHTERGQRDEGWLPCLPPNHPCPQGHLSAWGQWGPCFGNSFLLGHKRNSEKGVNPLWGSSGRRRWLSFCPSWRSEVCRLGTCLYSTRSPVTGHRTDLESPRLSPGQDPTSSSGGGPTGPGFYRCLSR